MFPLRLVLRYHKTIKSTNLVVIGRGRICWRDPNSSSSIRSQEFVRTQWSREIHSAIPGQIRFPVGLPGACGASLFAHAGEVPYVRFTVPMRCTTVLLRYRREQQCLRSGRREVIRSCTRSCYPRNETGYSTLMSQSLECKMSWISSTISPMIFSVHSLPAIAHLQHSSPKLRQVRKASLAHPLSTVFMLRTQLLRVRNPHN